jgi:hypothetical protein
MMRCAATLTLAILAAGSAVAQAPAPGDSARKVIGTWEFSNADRDKICTATFKADPVAVGFKVEFDKNCASQFPVVTEVAGWIYPNNDLLRLLNADRKSLVEFSEVEDGIYEAPTPGLGVLFLQNAAANGPAAKPAAQVAGNWAIARPNGPPLCRLALTEAAAGDDALAVTVEPGCDAALARLGFAQWRMDRGELMLYPARGNPWRFEVVDAASWRRLPESDNGYMLVKQE